MKKDNENERSAIVVTKVYSIINFVFAGLTLLFGLILMIFSSKLSELYYSGVIAGLTSNPQSLFLVIGILMFIAGLIGLAIAWGLWKFRNWARIFTLVLVGISLLFTIMDLFNTFIAWNLIWVIIDGAIIYLFGIYRPIVHLFYDPFLSKKKSSNRL